jgi:hypothetical protein
MDLAGGQECPRPLSPHETLALNLFSSLLRQQDGDAGIDGEEA